MHVCMHVHAHAVMFIAHDRAYVCMHACMLATCVLQACYMHATLIMHFTCIQHHYTMHVYQTCMYMLCNMHVTCITFRVGIRETCILCYYPDTYYTSCIAAFMV